MKKKLKIMLSVISIVFVCLWFLGILFAYFIRNAVVMPALSHLNYSIHELSLKRAAIDGNDLYLLGLQMTFPSRQLRSGSAVPFFNDHIIETASVFFKDREAAVGNLIVNVYPDNVIFRSSITPPVSKMVSRFLCGSESTYALLKTIHESKVLPFSWWNLVADAKQTYLLFLKSIITPYWFHNGTVYHVELDNLSGFLAEGKYGSDRRITQLIFAKSGTLYDIIVIDRSGRNFKDFLSTLKVAEAADVRNIINKYPQNVFSRDLILLSRLTDTISVDEFEELVGLTEMRKSAGETTVKETQALHEELRYLINMKNNKPVHSDAPKGGA